MQNSLSIHSLSLSDLGEILVEQGEKAFRAKQIFHWLYERKEGDWEKMTDLNKELREKLKAKFSLPSLKLRRTLNSEDGETIKFLWELEDQQLVESVLICSAERRTVCVSSQVGCPARCAFCASGMAGFKRNLSSSEIFEQVYQIDRWLHEKGERVSHVVYMGMGEPFENYEQVVASIRLLIDPLRLNLSQRRITVSTVGVVRGFAALWTRG